MSWFAIGIDETRSFVGRKKQFRWTVTQTTPFKLVACRQNNFVLLLFVAE